MQKILSSSSLSINDFNKVQDGAFNVVIEDVQVEILVQNSNFMNNKLYVLLSGARDPNIHPIPKFDRWKWKDKFDGLMVNVSDPSFYKKESRLRLGWYIGSQGVDYTKLVATVISKIAAIAGIKNENIIFYGSSAGGYASLSVGSELDGCKAIVINPQTDIRNYIPASYNSFLNSCYGVDSGDLKDTDIERFHILNRSKITKFSKIIYAQNIYDTEHIAKHYIPFCEMMNVSSLGQVSDDGKIETLLYESKNGHGAEPKEIVSTLLFKVMDKSRKGSWLKSLKIPFHSIK